jgi:hypothetical protein
MAVVRLRLRVMDLALDVRSWRKAVEGDGPDDCDRKERFEENGDTLRSALRVAPDRTYIEEGLHHRSMARRALPWSPGENARASVRMRWQCR